MKASVLFPRSHGELRDREGIRVSGPSSFVPWLRAAASLNLKSSLNGEEGEL